MRHKIKLALVGRPNVGKSALFNRLCRKRISIVDDEEGTTRDRIYGETEVFGHLIDVIDTGGIALDPNLPFQEGIQKQVALALEEADTVVMVVDGKAGVTPADEFVARLLMKKGKTLTLAVNKVDDYSMMQEAYEFYALGIENVIGVSALHGLHLAELLETALQGLELEELEEIESSRIKVAIVGRPNVGKSTIINHLLAEERSVVSPVAGTTRDAIDADITLNGVEMTLIDTAGIRRKKSEHEVVDKFAAIRTAQAIERADICVLVIEGPEGLTAQDKKIASLIEESGKGCILIFNKWDLIQGFRMEHCLKSVQYEASFLIHCPIIFASAHTGRNLDKLPHLIQEVRKYQTERITTGQLNKFIERTIQLYHPPMIQGKRLRIYYMTHVETQPPTFVLFVNYPTLMLETYKRYLIRCFRKQYKFTGNPILFVLKHRSRAGSQTIKDSAVEVPHLQEIEIFEESEGFEEPLEHGDFE
ncbi:MAG: ribosome biogenesis GTPase Der [Candidatus Rhabdochlamydia sp.]